MSTTSEISVIIPCYNAEPFVGEAIESVLAQTHDSIELIVVDDGSTDRSLEVIRSFGDDVQVIAQENHGACYARNRGGEAAEGAYLMFMDADDVIAPETIQALRDAIGERDEALARCRWKRLIETSEGWTVQPSTKAPAPPQNDPILGWLSGWFVPPCGLLWTRNAFETAGPWDEELAANQDGDLVLRGLLNGVSLVEANHGQTLYRKHNRPGYESVSSRSSEKALRSRGRVLDKVTRLLEDQGRLAPYRDVIARKYYTLARRLAVRDAKSSRRFEARAYALAGTSIRTGSWPHRLVTQLIGLQAKERLRQSLRPAD
jgi:glycosyltransferase involved in cell wall biosynthesis